MCIAHLVKPELHLSRSGFPICSRIAKGSYPTVSSRLVCFEPLLYHNNSFLSLAWLPLLFLHAETLDSQMPGQILQTWYASNCAGGWAVTDGNSSWQLHPSKPSDRTWKLFSDVIFGTPYINARWWFPFVSKFSPRFLDLKWSNLTCKHIFFNWLAEKPPTTGRITPLSKWLVTPI